MKDEEMADKHAEEYVMREDVITGNDRVPFDNGYGFQTVDFEKEVKKGFKDGFLAGLKAGRPQWHDLRKDPNDLPKDNNEVLVYMWDSYYTGYFNLDSWHFENFSEGKEQADAWCEIPTFDKEIEK